MVPLTCDSRVDGTVNLVDRTVNFSFFLELVNIILCKYVDVPPLARLLFENHNISIFHRYRLIDIEKYDFV